MLSCIVGAILCHHAAFYIAGNVASAPSYQPNGWAYAAYAVPVLGPALTPNVLLQPRLSRI